MGYEVKDTAVKSPLRPWDIYKDGKLIAGGFSTKGAAFTEMEAREGEEKLRAIMKQKNPDRYT